MLKTQHRHQKVHSCSQYICVTELLLEDWRNETDTHTRQEGKKSIFIYCNVRNIQFAPQYTFLLLLFACLTDWLCTHPHPPFTRLWLKTSSNHKNFVVCLMKVFFMLPQAGVCTWWKSEFTFFFFSSLI